MQFKGGETEFVPTKLMTRLTYTLDEASGVGGRLTQTPPLLACLLPIAAVLLAPARSAARRA